MVLVSYWSALKTKGDGDGPKPVYHTRIEQMQNQRCIINIVEKIKTKIRVFGIYLIDSHVPLSLYVEEAWRCGVGVVVLESALHTTGNITNSCSRVYK